MHSLLSRAHSNYLAQINIRMNERAERTNDVLGTLTVLGTIVLPMNIVTGLWGMNTKVPGQDGSDLSWFWSITGGLFAFGLVFFMICRKFLRLI
jgi:magnesium transporter